MRERGENSKLLVSFHSILKNILARTMESAPSLVELTQLTIDECFVYKVPPLRAASGHRAEEWGLAEPILTAVLKVVQVGDVLYVRLFEQQTSKLEVTSANVGTVAAVASNTKLVLFAECPLRLLGTTAKVSQHVEPTIDSSRYFVIRVEQRGDSRRHGLIGIGFRERQSSFDFKSTLQDFERYCERLSSTMSAAASPVSSSEDDAVPKPARMSETLSLKENITIKLKCLNFGERCPSTSTTKSVTSGSKELRLMPPPPAMHSLEGCVARVDEAIPVAQRSEYGGGRGGGDEVGVEAEEADDEVAAEGGASQTSRSGGCGDCGGDEEWGEFKTAAVANFGGSAIRPSRSAIDNNGYSERGQEILKRLLASGDVGRAQELMKILAEKAPLPEAW
jgi:hypothetical protein